MSYPVKRCPWCGHDLEDPTAPTVETAIEKEKEIWHPCDIPDNMPDSITITDASDTWTLEKEVNWEP